MHIIFVSNNYTPYAAGVVNSINTAIAQLQLQGHTVTLITLDFLGTEHHDPAWVRRIPSLFRFRYKQNYMALPWRPNSYLRRWIEELKPDVVHVHHPFLLGALAVRIAKKMGIKTVFTYHTMYEAYAHYLPLPGWFAKSIIEKRVLAFCAQVDHIIVPSSGIKQYLAKHALYSTVIPSAIGPQFGEQPFCPKTLAKPYNLIYVGRFTKEKNISMLFDVMAQLPAEYQLTLLGYGHYERHLREYAYDFLRLSQERVRFIIQPDKQMVLEAYQKAYLFLFPSQTDTQGLVIAEAMACSTPVIALDGYGQRDIIQQGSNGFIVQNAAQMALAIQHIVQDSTGYAVLQQGAYTTSKSYTADTFLPALISLYQQRNI